MTKTPELPFKVKDQAHLEIPLSDGCRLSARAWWPIDAGPVPVILEYLPYRKRDGTAARDALTHPYLAAHGYVCVRVDMRGCGDSEGLFDDEYSEQEISDGIEVVNWLASQDWCSGQVGMMGISWGGFNGLQIAARAPEPLKAIVTICSSVDRFADDIHYKGGVMLGENAGWAATALSWLSMPPDPEIVGDRWQDMWLERLKNTPFLLERWTQHQTRDTYWRHGSVCEDYSAIKAAVLSVGGWHDGYRNTISHLVSNLESPVKGIIGPWNHKYPHIAVPGPRIDFLGEVLRWWDHWLKGIDRGIGADPALRAYIMDSIAPAVSYAHRPGRWVAVEEWPLRDSPTTLSLNGRNLETTPGPVNRPVHTRLGCGQGTGEYFPFGFGPGELPDDQTADDGLSCCFDSAPLQQSLDFLGAAKVTLRLSADQDRGQLAIRLCDLRPDGTSALIAHGFLNLRHRDGHEKSAPLAPNEEFDVTIDLDHCGYHLPAGHSLRIAISTSYWPFVWPEGRDVTFQVHSGKVHLPVLPPDAQSLCAFGQPVSAQPRAERVLSECVESKRIVTDVAKGEIRHEILGDRGAIEDLTTGLVTGARVSETFSVRPADPGSARADFRWDRTLSRGDWSVSSAARVEMTAEAGTFAINMSLSANVGDSQVFDRSWKARVPRS
ncbi:MAG: CocE/NonD family hydrolase [Rhodobacteraceae bacterium]|nr:CocE/NonD family hydrolase [Paracoccaceae bacterium]